MDKHVDIFESEFWSWRFLISYSFDFGFGVWYGPAYSLEAGMLVALHNNVKL